VVGAQGAVVGSRGVWRESMSSGGGQGEVKES